MNNMTCCGVRGITYVWTLGAITVTLHCTVVDYFPPTARPEAFLSVTFLQCSINIKDQVRSTQTNIPTTNNTLQIQSHTHHAKVTPIQRKLIPKKTKRANTRSI